jgi:hypothetical protein
MISKRSSKNYHNPTFPVQSLQSRSTGQQNRALQTCASLQCLLAGADPANLFQCYCGTTSTLGKSHNITHLSLSKSAVTLYGAAKQGTSVSFVSSASLQCLLAGGDPANLFQCYCQISSRIPRPLCIFQFEL